MIVTPLRARLHTDSHFKRTMLSVGGSVERVKRRFAVATVYSARFSWRFRVGAGARVAACGRARLEPARPAYV